MSFNAAKKKLAIERCHRYAESRGGKCHATEYVTAQLPMEWECAKGHRWWVRPDFILPRGKTKAGSWCRQCSNEAKHLFSSEQEAEIAKRMATGMMEKDIAAELGCSTPTIRCARRRGGLAELPRRVPIHNESAFDPLTPEGEYWIGFLMADGYVAGRNNTVVGIRLKRNDEEHIHAFKEFIGAEHTIYHDDNALASGIRFTSEKITSDLATYGVVPRKSLIAEAKGGIEKSRHFWRGIVDGDGHLSRSPRSCAIELGCGSERIVQQFLDFINNSLDSPVESKVCLREPSLKDSRKNDFFRVVVSRIKIIGLLYGDCETAPWPALPRKLERAKEMVADWTTKCICLDCGSQDVPRRNRSQLCPPCQAKRRCQQNRERYRANPEKQLARSTVAYAINSGKLATPGPCSNCGDAAAIYFHHLGYERKHWFDVIPLCGPCRKKIQ